MASKVKKSGSIRQEVLKSNKVGKSGKENGKQKKSLKITKAQSKATKIKIDKLNANVEELNEITQLLGKSLDKPKSALDVKSLKEGLKEDEKSRAQNKLVDQDLTNQLELLTGMGL
ncbi:uncharacterized protein RJT21DRAFT_38780 [Scheffersomyces amazonensis]|uniref:uncharacterized protein n=1 Tax=Scheffersomyces amazonensis TaxID=1078765 RepID=UPI00315CB84D